MGTVVGIGVVLVRRSGPAARPAHLPDVVKPGAAAGFNVLLITLDTTRPDHLGCYGYKPARTPTIDALAARGFRFDNAVCSMPMTLPSHATMLTGLAPPSHGARGNGLYHLPPDRTTLAESLKARAYDTAAFVSCFVLDERFGLNQGFDVYDLRIAPDGFMESNVDMNERSAGEVTDAVLEWFGRRDARSDRPPFFLWVHYFDPHSPYRSPWQDRPEYAGRPYDAEIAYMDSQIGRLLSELDRRSLRNRTLIVVASDHGDAFGEHDEPSHGFFVYESTVRVAFILSCPALFDRAYHDAGQLAGLVDLRPTIEELLGLTPAMPCDGVSLVRPSDTGRAVYVETLMPMYGAGWSPLFAMRGATDKYILAPESEYYDLSADPGERKNLAAALPPAGAALRQRLDDYLERTGARNVSQAAARTLTAEEAQRLAAMGYVLLDDTTKLEDLPDPKEMVPKFRAALEALAVLEQGRAADALPLALKAVDGCETCAPAHRILADVYVALGRTPDAIRVLRDSARVNPQFLTFTTLAQVLQGAHQYEEAEVALQRAEMLDPNDGRVPMIRGDLLAAQWRYAEAAAEYERAIRIDERRVGIPAREQLRKIGRLLNRPPSDVSTAPASP